MYCFFSSLFLFLKSPFLLTKWQISSGERPHLFASPLDSSVPSTVPGTKASCKWRYKEQKIVKGQRVTRKIHTILYYSLPVDGGRAVGLNCHKRLHDEGNTKCPEGCEGVNSKREKRAAPEGVTVRATAQMWWGHESVWDLGRKSRLV